MRRTPAVKIGPNDFGSRFYSPLLPDLQSPKAGSNVPFDHVIWVM